jgi:hypothetical protein
MEEFVDVFSKLTKQEAVNRRVHHHTRHMLFAIVTVFVREINNRRDMPDRNLRRRRINDTPHSSYFPPRWIASH